MTATQCPARCSGVLRLGIAALAVAIGLSNPVHADPPRLVVVAQSDLTFGSLVVFGNGSRTVTATGSVIDSGIMPWGPQSGSPALFTVSYDRGNEGRRVLDLQIELVLSNVPSVNLGGVAASLGNFDSTVPGALQIEPGRPFSLRIPNCDQRVCSVSFAVGGRIDVTRYQGGADLRFPLMVDATLVSVK